MFTQAITQVSKIFNQNKTLVEDVPKTKRKYNRGVYPFRSMIKGDSFLVPFDSEPTEIECERLKNKVNQLCYQARIRLNSLYSTKKYDNGFRVWCLKTPVNLEIGGEYKYKIEKGISRTNNKFSKYENIRTMEIGDSFVLSDEYINKHYNKSVNIMLNSFKQRYGHNFYAVAEGVNLRVWRIDENKIAK